MHGIDLLQTLESEFVLRDLSGTQPKLGLACSMLPCRAGLAGSKDYRPFVIVGSNRTGTNFLLHLMKTTGDVVGFAELFSSHGPFWSERTYAPLSSSRARQLRERDPAQFIERAVFRRYPSSIRAVGFKAHYGQLEKYPAALAWLRDREDLVILHLRRRNLLAVAASKRRAQSSGQRLQASNDSTVDSLQVALDPTELFEAFDAYDRNLNWPERNLPEAAVVNLCYEDLVSDTTRALSGLPELLGIDSSKAFAGTAKQNPLGWRGVVTNVDEIESAVGGSRWAYLLDLPE